MSESHSLGFKASKLEEKLPSLLEGQEKLEQMDLDAYCLECLENNRQYADLWNLTGDISTGHYQKTIRNNKFTVCRLAYPESDMAIDVYPDGFTQVVKLNNKLSKTAHLWDAWEHQSQHKTHPRRRARGAKPSPFFKSRELVNPSS